MNCNVKQAYDLIASCENVLNDCENRIPPLRGIRNLSRSDLDTAILYAQTIARCGDGWRNELMQPRGGVEMLLTKFKVL